MCKDELILTFSIIVEISVETSVNVTIPPKTAATCPGNAQHPHPSSSIRQLSKEMGELYSRMLESKKEPFQIT